MAREQNAPPQNFDNQRLVALGELGYCCTGIMQCITADDADDITKHKSEGAARARENNGIRG